VVDVQDLQRVVLYADSVEHAVTAPESSGLATGRGGELAARSLSQVMTAQASAPAHVRPCQASEGSAPEVLDDPGDHQPGTDDSASQWHGMVADETGGRRGAPVLDDGEQVHDGDAQQDDADDQEPDGVVRRRIPALVGAEGWFVWLVMTSS